MEIAKQIRSLTLIICCAAMVIPGAAQENPKLTDEEVASVAVTANQIDINSGRLAKQKSSNEKVRQFAETMIQDHQAVIDQASALVKKLGVTPKDNAVSKQLMDNAAQAEKALQAKSGKEFDQAYVDHEVKYHEAVIDAVKGLLIPETENAELKALLEGILPALDAHLGHARMLQKELSK